MKEQKKDKRYHFGTQLGYQYKWDESKKQFYRTGRARKLPIHGPINWDQLWPEWDDVGEDFTQKGSETDPLTEVQTETMNDECDIRVSEWTQQLGSGKFAEVWSVMYQRRIGPKKSETENPENHVNQWDVPSSAACKLMRFPEDIKKSGISLQSRWTFMMKDMSALRYLKHENIVQMIDLSAIQDSQTRFPYSTVLLLLELCDGDLVAISDACNAIIPLEVCYKWMRDIASGLVYMHEKNMTHMDVKPANILFKWATPGNTELSMIVLMQQYETMIFKLGDMGSCMSFQPDEPAITKDLIGTPNFAAPEICALQKIPYKERTAVHCKPCDVYSFGATLLKCRMPNHEYIALRNRGPALQKMMRDIRDGTREYQNISANLARFINTMVQIEWQNRPTIQQVLQVVEYIRANRQYILY